MVWFRLVFGLLLVGAIGCFTAYLIGRRRAWLQRGILLVKWTLFAAFGFFAVLIVQRLLDL